jgi:hypothetical protein
MLMRLILSVGGLRCCWLQMFVLDCQTLVGYSGEFDGGDLLSSASTVAQLLFTVDFSAQANGSAHARFNPTERPIC